MERNENHTFTNHSQYQYPWTAQICRIMSKRRRSSIRSGDRERRGRGASNPSFRPNTLMAEFPDPDPNLSAAALAGPQTEKDDGNLHHKWCHHGARTRLDAFREAHLNTCPSWTKSAGVKKKEEEQAVCLSVCPPGRPGLSSGAVPLLLRLRLITETAPEVV